MIQLEVEEGILRRSLVEKGFRNASRNGTIFADLKEDFFKMLNAKILAIIAINWALGLVIAGQMPASVGPASKRPAISNFMPLSQVKEGMRGKARTVFRGSDPDQCQHSDR